VSPKIKEINKRKKKIETRREREREREIIQDKKLWVMHFKS
jgi:hypothetical protein